MIAIALFYLLFSIAFCGRNNLDAVYGLFVFGQFIVTLALLALIVFGYVAVHRGGWLSARLANPSYWARTAACLRHRDVCYLNKNHDNHGISPIEL
uniref:Uncharacterized protein n=1 Tax=Oryza brachyantha TaxID=4533 RepID=J3LUW0_ORYBR